MRTARLLPVSPSMHCAGGPCLLPGRCLLVGSLLPGGSALGGVSQHAVRQTPDSGQNDRQVYKHNLRKLRLWAVTMKTVMDPRGTPGVRILSFSSSFRLKFSKWYVGTFGIRTEIATEIFTISSSGGSRIFQKGRQTQKLGCKHII